MSATLNLSRSTSTGSSAPQRSACRGTSTGHPIGPGWIGNRHDRPPRAPRNSTGERGPAASSPPATPGGAPPRTTPPPLSGVRIPPHRYEHRHAAGDDVRSGWSTRHATAHSGFAVRSHGENPASSSDRAAANHTDLAAQTAPIHQRHRPLPYCATSPAASTRLSSTACAFDQHHHQPSLGPDGRRVYPRSTPADGYALQCQSDRRRRTGALHADPHGWRHVPRAMRCPR